MDENWVITIQGPQGVKHIEILDSEIKAYRKEADIPPKNSDYQLAMYLAYNAEFYDD